MLAVITAVLNATVESITGHFNRFEVAEITGETFGSETSRIIRTSMIIANWCGIDGRSAWKDTVFHDVFR